MNVQVHRTVSDLTGKTGLWIVRAIVGGERDPLRLADLREGCWAAFMAELGLISTGALWGTITNLNKQIYALPHAKLSFVYGQRRQRRLVQLAVRTLRSGQSAVSKTSTAT